MQHCLFAENKFMEKYVKMNDKKFMHNFPSVVKCSTFRFYQLKCYSCKKSGFDKYLSKCCSTLGFRQLLKKTTSLLYAFINLYVPRE